MSAFDQSAVDRHPAAVAARRCEGLPRLQPAGTPSVMDGVEVAPAGSREGEEMEVAFVAGRHDVLVAAGPGVPEAVATEIRTSGWTPLGKNDTAEVWVRDRAESALAGLERAASSSAPVIGLGVAR